MTEGGGAEGMALDRIDLLDACMSRLASDCAKALRWRTTVPVRLAECIKRVARLMEDHGVSRDPASYPGGVAGVSSTWATQIHHIDNDNARHDVLCAEFLHSCATTSSVARAHGRHVRGLEAAIQGAELATFEALQSELRLVFERYEHTFSKVMFDRERRVAALERRGPPRLGRPWTDGPRLIKAESDALAVEGNATYRTRAAMCQVVQEWRTAVAAFCDVRIIRDVPFRVTDARSLGASDAPFASRNGSSISTAA